MAAVQKREQILRNTKATTISRLPSQPVWWNSVWGYLSCRGLISYAWTLQCLQKEMATYRHWSVSLWRDPDDVSYCLILSPDKTEWRLISATLCRWRRCFVADQLWLMKRIREEEEEVMHYAWKWPQRLILLTSTISQQRQHLQLPVTVCRQLKLWPFWWCSPFGDY